MPTKKTASKKRSARKTGARGSSVKKASARKSTARKFIRRGAKKASSGKRAVMVRSAAPGGHVYVFTTKGTRVAGVHVAKKATAHEIKNTLGISNSLVTSAERTLRDLEAKGRIPRTS